MKDTKRNDPSALDVDVMDVACEVAEKAVVEAIWRTSRMAGVSPDANEAMKFSQAALNLAHVLASLDCLGEKS
tara:strand:+ start:44 stop:262 length:219 start_codon:yes stop_codon:yes gene_type:complete